jgi:hypothetical protein
MEGITVENVTIICSKLRSVAFANSNVKFTMRLKHLCVSFVRQKTNLVLDAAKRSMSLEKSLNTAAYATHVQNILENQRDAPLAKRQKSMFLIEYSPTTLQNSYVKTAIQRHFLSASLAVTEERLTHLL